MSYLKILFLAPLLIALGVRINAQNAGDLDSSFGSNGIVISDFGGNESIKNILIQNDGKILVVGYSGNDLALARYNGNGALDETFGTNGKTITDIDDGSIDAGNAIGLSDRIIIGGSASGKYALVAYTPEGDIDSAFGTNGKTILPFAVSQGSFGFTDIKIQVDGKIIACGNNLIIRFNADGTVDSSFGINGMDSLQAGEGVFFCIAIQPDGKILAGGGGQGGFRLARYVSNGLLDPGFGSNGIVNTMSGFDGGQGPIYTLVVQPDGKILASGVGGTILGDTRLALIRYMNDGSMDSSFAGGTLLNTSFYLGHPPSSNCMSEDNEGGIFAVINSYDSMGIEMFSMVKYASDGTIDTMFGSNGIVATPVSSTNAIPHAIALQSDGKIILAGDSGNSGFTLARYLSVTDSAGTGMNHIPGLSKAISLYPNPAA